MVNRSWIVVLLLLPLMGYATEITAERMVILNTEQGKVTLFEENVLVSDGATRITAPRMEFYDQHNRAIIHGGTLTITVSGTTVTAESAEYLVGEKRIRLYRNVVLRKDETVLASPRVVIDIPAERVFAFEGVKINDWRRGIEITGESGDFDLSSQDGSISGAARLEVSQARNLIIASQFLQLSNTEQTALATGGVTADVDDARLTCDTLWYFLDWDSAWAAGAPEVTMQDGRIIGERMDFRFGQNQLEELIVVGGKTMATLIHKEDRISGRKIAVQFAAGEPAIIQVTGDSALCPAIHRASSHASARGLLMVFDQGEIRQIILSGNSTGSYLSDDGDRIELGGSETRLVFREGGLLRAEVTDVRDGRLLRGAGRSGDQRPSAQPTVREPEKNK